MHDKDDLRTLPALSGDLEIARERRRQVEVEGWDSAHDDAHVAGELLQAADCYIGHAQLGEVAGLDSWRYQGTPPPAHWPWDPRWWKPKTPFGDLVKAGALIAAELDRRARLGEGGRAVEASSPEIAAAFDDEREGES